MAKGRSISLAMLLVFFTVSGPVGCKKDSATKGTASTAVEKEKLIESEPEKKHDEEYYEGEEEGEPEKEEGPYEGS